MWPVGGEGLGGFGCCHGCVVLVLVWQVTSGKNLRRIDGMCAKSRITEAEGGKWTGCHSAYFHCPGKVLLFYVRIL